MMPMTIRITPTTCGSTLPPLVLTAQVRIAPNAIRTRLMMIPMPAVIPEAREFQPPDREQATRREDGADDAAADQPLRARLLVVVPVAASSVDLARADRFSMRLGGFEPP